MSNDVESLQPGTGCYAALLTPKGKMLGGLRILGAGEDLLLDTERVGLQALFNAIRLRRAVPQADARIRAHVADRSRGARAGA